MDIFAAVEFSVSREGAFDAVGGIGEPLYVQAAVKDRRRYRYYVSRALVRGSEVEGQRGWRVPGPELERAVAIAARNILDDNAAILEALQVARMGDADFNSVFGLVAEWSDSELAGARDSAFPPLY